MAKIHDSILSTVGQTPMVRLEHLTEGLGREYYEQLRPWLQAIANDGTPSDETHFVDPFVAWVRGGTSVLAMGLNFSTAAKQFLGLITALDAMPPQYLLAGMAKAMTPEGWRFANEQSGEVRNIAESMDRDIRKLAKEAFGQGQG